MPERRPERAPTLTRADLPAEFTPDTVRALPLGTLRRLTDHRSSVLTPEEQREFEKALHEVMGDTARRLAGRLTKTDWQAERAAGNRRPSRSDVQLERLARRIGQQVGVAEKLAPGIDWSFAPPATDPAAEPADQESELESATDSAEDETGSVTDLEQRISDQAELLEVISDMADVSRRTFALEQQRDLQNTRGIFFGFVVSVAVLVAGWAPLVTARDWTERWWMIGLTLGTCAAAGLVYFLVRRYEKSEDTDA